MKKIHIITIISAISTINTTTIAFAKTTHSTNLYGALGLNTVPSARMDETGTVRAQISHLDPYLNGFIGMQIAEPLYIGIRQTAEFSSLNEDAKALYPGIDAKLRLAKESPRKPAIAMGVQSGIGHTRQSGEYIAFSKRYKNFDFTTGIGWGRFASAAHIDNPFKALGGHFDKDRALDSNNPTQPNDWFTGQHVGFFGGVEYFTPLKGLSLKADYGGDDYEAEQATFNLALPPLGQSALITNLGISWISASLPKAPTKSWQGSHFRGTSKIGVTNPTIQNP